MSVPRWVPPRYPERTIGTDTGCSASTDLPPGHGCPVAGRFGDFETKPLELVMGEQGARRMRQDDVTLVVIVAGAIDERG